MQIFKKRAEGEEIIENKEIYRGIYPIVGEFFSCFLSLYVGDIKKKSGGYEQISKQWKYLLISLIIFAFVAIFTIDWVIYFIIYNNLSDKIKVDSEFIKSLPLYFGSIKLTFFSILGYAIFVANKNFSNNRHLYNVYLQKADSLEIFTTYISIIPDNEVKNRATDYITKTIFEPVQTGFIKESPEGDSKIISNLVGSIPK